MDISTIRNIKSKIIYRIPDCNGCSTPKRDNRKIQEILCEHGYDDDFIEKISFDFCYGFGVAKAIILEILDV